MQPLLDELRNCYSLAECDSKRANDTADDYLVRSIGTTLGDCVGVRYAVESEFLHGIRNPKESFLTILVRNALCSNDKALVSQ